MFRLVGLSMGLLLTIAATAQSGWNWPEDPEKHDMAKEKQAYYKLLMTTDKWQECWQSVQWLYANTPDLHESIYQDGPKIIDNLIEKGVSDKRAQVLRDSLLWTYDMRIKYFGDEASVIDRKAYSAFKMYYKVPSKYALLKELYDKLYSFSANDISDFNLTPYMTLATYYYKSKPDELPATDVLDIHTKITSVIEEKISTGGNKDKLSKEQDKIDAFLSSLGSNLISCDFIEENLVPKLKANPNDVNTAKKIFSYSLTAKCSDQPYFVQAGEVLFTTEPSFSLAKALADKYYRSDDYAKATEYYGKAKDLTEDPEQKFDAYMGLASVAFKQGDKRRSRSLAYEALSVKPGSAEAYNLIGNLYFVSFEECKGGESRVKDRGVFLAAYEMYQKAGNTKQMAAAEAQFPSIEEIFSESYEEGQKLTVDCWINESVTIKRRN
ncbi:tetratricopeptide repeat protein [Marinoscillum pacificum]|uniref:tetratricopeptide repeat protein n=1 Tax=Marinoscillum pacificum TaxID=392723 RepID=UPI002157C862|nr:tetratricopeptide repeat protein [Marinoscillum pacificum]